MDIEVLIPLFVLGIGLRILKGTGGIAIRKAASKKLREEKGEKIPKEPATYEQKFLRCGLSAIIIILLLIMFAGG